MRVMQAWSIRPQSGQPHQGAAGQERQQQVVAPGQPQVQVHSHPPTMLTPVNRGLSAVCSEEHTPVFEQTHDSKSSDELPHERSKAVCFICCAEHCLLQSQDDLLEAHNTGMHGR